MRIRAKMVYKPRSDIDYFENVGILQVYSFNHSDVFFSPIAYKYLENFIALLEEIKEVLSKLKLLPKQSVDSSDASTNMVPGDLIAAPDYMQEADIFVSEHLITPVSDHLSQPNDELRSFITTPTILTSEPATTSSWIPTEDKDEPDDQEKEDVAKLKENTTINLLSEDSEKLQCSICNKAFVSKASLKYHEGTHRDDYLSSEDNEKFQCPVCNKVLGSKTSLKSHLATHSGQKPFCCEHCGKLFTTNLNLAAHLTRQHNLNTESANPCSECGKLFVRRSALDTHMKCHMGVKPWACNYCDKTFTQKVTRDIHLLTHTRDYKFCCGKCGKRFPTQAKFNYHHKTHGEPLFMCNLCNKKFTTKQYLNAHLRTHDAQAHCRLDTVSCQIVENRFGCLQCNLSFPSQHKLALHSDKHNPLSIHYRYNEKCKMVPRQKHRCLVCGKEFLLKPSLIHHQQQKHPNNQKEKQQRQISCNICEKKFTVQKKLQRHMQIHTQRDQHSCSVCGRTFLRKDSLQRHVGTLHSTSFELNPCPAEPTTESHQCSRCGKTFRSKTALKFHDLSHDGKFKYQCNICGRQFVRNCHFQSHLLSHSSDRPYKCDTCGKSFKLNKTFREHSKRIHTEQNPVINTADQITTGHLAAPQLSAGEMAASQLTIQSLLAGDDATYGQTYDQFQASVQLQ